jgi:hypothetical protein
VTICVGNHRASLKSLRNAFYRLHDVQRLTDQRLITQQQFDRIAELHEESDVFLSNQQSLGLTEDLIYIVLTSANRQCSDPRDRLFAMKGIFHVRNKPNLRTDYRASVAKVYRQFVGHIFKFAGAQARADGIDPNHHAACILALSATTFGDGGPGADWRSWVPDSHGTTKSSVTTFNMYNGNTYRDWSFHPEAWPFSRSSIRFKATNPIDRRIQLHVGGRIFGHVQSVLRLPSQGRIALQQRQEAEEPTESSIDEILSWYIDVCDFLQMDLQMENIHDSRWDSLVQTILGCGIGCKQPNEDQPKLFHLLQDRWCLLDITKSEIQLNSLYYYLQPLLISRWARYQDWSRHLCSIALPELPPIIGWMTQTTSEDDSICYFAGAPYPFILQSKRNGMYKLLGHAWIHGLEEWQALGMPKEEWQLYERIDARFKSRSRWWEGEIMDLDDANREDELSLERWDTENLDKLVLC